MAKIAFITLLVKDMVRMRNFYEDIIGLTTIEQTGDAIKLAANGHDPLLILKQSNTALPSKTHGVGLYHFAFLLPSRADLGNMLAHFITQKIPLEGASDHDVSEAIYLSDPEGNGIEIYRDRSKREWTWKEQQIFMTTKQLDAATILSKRYKAFQKLPPKTMIGHVHLQVPELIETEKFFQNVLKFETTLHFGKQALFMARDQYHHHLGFNTWNSFGAEADTLERYGLMKITIEVDQNWAKELPFNFDQQTDHIIEDPNGILFHLQLKQA